MSQPPKVAGTFHALQLRLRLGRIAALSMLTLSVSAIAYGASAPPARIQYEIYQEQSSSSDQQPNDQQSKGLDPARDLQTVGGPQTPPELQSNGYQAAGNRQQPNAFVSDRSNEGQNIARTETQSSDRPNSPPPSSQGQQPPASTQIQSGADDAPRNP